MFAVGLRHKAIYLQCGVCCYVGKDLMFAVGLRRRKPFRCKLRNCTLVGKDLMFAVGLRRETPVAAVLAQNQIWLEKT